jgi:hypothetical protein
MSHRIDHVSHMKTGLLKRSLIALLMFAVASAWQISPSVAGTPCHMSQAGITSGGPGPDRHCKSGDCTAAMVCCQPPANFVAPYNASVTSVVWTRIVWTTRIPTLIGLHLLPDLHPPTALV